MGKRKIKDAASNGHGAGSEEDSDMEMLDVDFEWFDPQPEVDFHGLKTLCRQLFDIDAQLFDLSALVDLILSQPLLGSTVKVDGNETDPYAFLTVLNLAAHRDKPIIQSLTRYLLRRLPASLSPLTPLLAPNSKAQVGLILTERLLNMPSEICPPMYNFLREEIQWALDEKEPYQFSHYLIWSKVYTEVASPLDAEGGDSAERPAKKPKKKAAGDGESNSEVFYFHPEDEVLQRFALASGRFEYETKADDGASDSRRVFSEMGIKPRASLILIEAGRFAQAVEAVAEYLKPPA